MAKKPTQTQHAKKPHPFSHPKSSSQAVKAATKKSQKKSVNSRAKTESKRVELDSQMQAVHEALMSPSLPSSEPHHGSVLPAPSIEGLTDTMNGL